MGLVVRDVDERLLLVAGTLALTKPERAEGDEGDGGEDRDNDTGNGSGFESLGAGIQELLDGVLLRNVAKLGGLLLAELSDHGILAAPLLEGVLDVVDFRLEVGVNIFQVDVVQSNRLEESLEEFLPIVDGSTVGGVVLEVLGQGTGLDGELELDVGGIVVVELVLVNAEKGEKVGKGLVVVSIRDDELTGGDGLLDLNVKGQILDGVICLLSKLSTKVKNGKM